MASPNKEELDLIGKMTGKLGKSNDETRQRSKANNYYAGSALFTKLGFAVPEGLDMLTTILNLSKIVGEAIEERIGIEGFRLPPERNPDGSFKDIDPSMPDTDDEMWRWWQANDLDDESHLGHVDYIVSGAFYTTVGTFEDDEETPKITVESPDEVTCLFEADGRTPRAAWKLYDSEPEFNRQDRGTLYLPDETLYLRRGKGTGGWVYDEDSPGNGRDEHEVGEVLVTPFLNNARTRKRVGTSELTDVFTLQDAAVRNLTNLQVGQETHALPQRGVAGAAASDFKDEQGNPISQWEAYFGSVWTLANKDAKTFQFSPSDLQNFHSTTLHYARLVSMMYGLPPYYMGAGNDNGPGADSIRATEARLIMRIKRKILGLSAGWERTMRLGKFVVLGEEPDPRYKSMEVLFANPETPTYAQIIDGVVKLHTEGLLSTRDALEEIPTISAIRRERILANLAAEAEQKAEQEQKATLALADAMRVQTGVEPDDDGADGGVPGFDPSSRV